MHTLSLFGAVWSGTILIEATYEIKYKYVEAFTKSLIYAKHICLFAWFDSLRPINNLSVI